MNKVNKSKLRNSAKYGIVVHQTVLKTSDKYYELKNNLYCFETTKDFDYRINKTRGLNYVICVLLNI